MSHTWLSALQAWYSINREAVDLLSQLALGSTACPHYSWRQGTIRYKRRIWLGTNVTLQQQVILALHDSPVGSHSGAPQLYRKFVPYFSGLVCTRRYFSSCSPAQFVSRLSQTGLATRASYNLCQCPVVPGNSFLWILLRGYHCRVDSML
jgi:hypothetical protein